MNIGLISRYAVSMLSPVLFVLILYHIVLSALYPDMAWHRLTLSVHELESATDFAMLLEEHETSLDRVRQSKETRPVYPQNLPSHLAKLPVPDKTTLFISLVLPSVVRVNDEIIATRQRVLELLEAKASSRRLTRKEQWWLNRVAWQYGCDPMDSDELLKRVDAVPVALALAQAIDESGWGTSRFAREGNALYGQHLSSSSKGRYIISLHGNVKVAAFDSIYDATRSYIHNLNSVWAYRELRDMRAEMREKGMDTTGYELAGGLLRYSELGEKYVRDLRSIIRRYELEQLNTVRIPDGDNRLVVKFSRKRISG